MRRVSIVILSVAGVLVTAGEVNLKEPGLDTSRVCCCAVRAASQELVQIYLRLAHHESAPT